MFGTFLFCDEELQAFIGLNIAMGLLKLPQIRDYWSTNEVLAMPWFPAVMSRDHFFTINGFIHLADSSKQKMEDEEGYDALYKVKPLIDHLTAVFSKYYQPARELSLDEMTIGTRCRISFLQCIPTLVLAERVGQRDVSECTPLADNAWRLLELAIERAWSALDGPFFCFLYK